MIWLNLIIVVLFILLALISRKHYSKYKGEKGLRSAFCAFYFAMGHSVWVFFGNIRSFEGIKCRLSDLLRKDQVVSPKRLELITERFMARCIGIGIFILTGFNFVDMGSGIYNHFHRDNENMIIREEYMGDVIEEEIFYQISGQEESLILSVSPVRLSREEFFEKSEVLAEKIREKYFPKNMLVSGDLELPTVDEEDVFLLSWTSDKPDVLSHRGSFGLEENQDSTTVNLTMTVTYFDYSREFIYEVLVGFGEKSHRELMMEGLEQALNNLEQANPQEKELLIPDEVGGIELELREQRNGSGRVLLLGLIFGIGAVGVSVSRLHESGKKRDLKLIREYPFFVDDLWLHIEAGMNIKRALQEYVNSANKSDDTLVREIKYTLNQIDNGEAEHIAYEELGARIGLPVYISLMRRISQNLRMGNKDLKELMESEVFIALESKRERAKRLGEEASTKLVFPMVVLLVVVMVVIMTPAFMGF